MIFNPRWFVIHNVGSPDKVGFDGNGIRRVLQERKLGGYHLLAEVIDGQFWTSVLNRLDRPAEHVARHNSEGVGYSFVGDFNANAPPYKLLESAAPDVASLLRRFGLTPAALIAHRDVPDNNTDCPGKLFTKALFENFRALVADQYRAADGGTTRTDGWRDSGASK